MINPIQLCDVAKLHQRDLEKEVALRQEAKLAESTKFFRPRSVNRFVMLSFFSRSNDRATKSAVAVSR